MAFAIHVLPQFKLCLITYSGAIGQSDFERLWPSLLATPGYDPSLDELVVYLPSAYFTNLDPEAIKIEGERLIIYSRGSSPERPKRRAMFSRDDEILALAKPFISHLRSTTTGNFEIEAFDTLEAALAWIAAGRTEGAAFDRLVSALTPLAKSA